MAKMHLVPIRRGYWGKNSGLPHTIPMKLSGTCGSVSVRLIPAPRGTGLVAAPASKKILAMAGLEVGSCVQQPMRPSARRGGGPAIRGRRVDDAKRQLTPLHTGLLLHDARPLAHHW